MEKCLVFLLDTNIWLERLLGQRQAEVVADLLDNLSPSDVHDRFYFTLYRGDL
jgi:hypothetical protein